MKIALIGMSGIGKSFWSQKLEQQGFKRFCCDDLIEHKLEDELKHLGYKGIHDVALWLGQPYEPQYAENSRKYLQFEQEIADKILEEVVQGKNENIVIDTTGSVIYLSADTLRRFKELTTVVYLSISDEVREKLYHQYLHHPKPVIWGEQFIPQDNETSKETLARCYLNLLDYRSHKYQELADVAVSYEQARAPEFDLKEIVIRAKE